MKLSLGKELALRAFLTNSTQRIPLKGKMAKVSSSERELSFSSSLSHFSLVFYVKRTVLSSHAYTAQATVYGWVKEEDEDALFSSLSLSLSVSPFKD